MPKFGTEPEAEVASTENVTFKVDCSVQGGDGPTETDIDISGCTYNQVKQDCDSECSVTIKDPKNNCEPIVEYGNCVSQRTASGIPQTR